MNAIVAVGATSMSGCEIWRQLSTEDKKIIRAGWDPDARVSGHFGLFELP